LDRQKQIQEVISEISKLLDDLRAYENNLESAGTAWIENLSKSLEKKSEESVINDSIIELTSLVKSLLSVSVSPQIHIFIGQALTLLMHLELKVSGSKKIMKRLLSQKAVELAERERKQLLVINPTLTSTKVAYFEGIEKMYETNIHLSPDVTDGVETRVESIVSWLREKGLDLKLLDGIACRSGFFQPVPTGTYRIVPEMVDDIKNPRIEHISNISIPITMKLAELSGSENEMLLTTSDPSVSDEIETVERLTGFIKIKRDGTGAHYLNHKAVLKVLSSILGRSQNDINVIVAHLGNGISIVLQRNGRIIAIVDAFSGVPASNRCGQLDLMRLIDGLKNDRITFKELEAVLFSRGGLLSLAGTDDFRTLDGFRNKGATAVQQKKIDLIFEFFSRQITSAMLKLTSDGKPVEMMVLTGGLVRSDKLVKRIEKNIAGRYPVVLFPDSIENESLAAGLIQGFYETETLKNYVNERDALKKKRHEEDRLIDTVIFDRKVIYRKKDAPIVSIDELIDATCITVKEHFLPTIAIIEADNEEAILAAKRANEEGSYRIAKFKLVGDFAAISQIAYDFDLMIDDDNFSIIDTESPVDEAIKLLDNGKVHILMKGKLKTEEVLRGVFHYLKDSGRLKSGELISHIFVMDIPVRNKLLLITDAAVNPYPDEMKKIKIIENALRVAFNLNIKKPKVAVISAIESVNLSVESSIEAERIAEHFVSRDDCIVEGPLSFDVAMDQDIAHEKLYKGTIQGTADILIMPDIDAGNVLYKSLTTQSGATCAGVILCGDMPLILTSRGDSAHSKLASISLAVKLFFDLQQK